MKLTKDIIATNINSFFNKLIDDDQKQIQSIECSVFEDSSIEFEEENKRAIAFLNNRIAAIATLKEKFKDPSDRFTLLQLAIQLEKISKTEMCKTYSNTLEEFTNYVICTLFVFAKVTNDKAD